VVTGGHASWSDNFTYLIENDGVAQGQSSSDLLRILSSRDGTEIATARTQFGEATEARFVDFDDGFDGVLGLGLANDGIVGRLLAAGEISKPIVGIDLQDQPPKASPASGLLSLGGVNTNSFLPGSMCYYEVVSNSSTMALQPTWTVPLSSVQVNGKEVDSQTVLSLNTASRWSYANPSIVDKVAQQVGAMSFQGLYLVNLSANFSVTFSLEEGDCELPSTEENKALSQKKTITLTQTDLLAESVVPGYGVLLFASYEHALQVASQDGGNSASQVTGWTLGLPFVKHSYIALDYGSATIGHTPRIGIAEKHREGAHSLQKTESRGIIII